MVAPSGWHGLKMTVSVTSVILGLGARVVAIGRFLSYSRPGRCPLTPPGLLLFSGADCFGERGHAGRPRRCGGPGLLGFTPGVVTDRSGQVPAALALAPGGARAGHVVGIGGVERAGARGALHVINVLAAAALDPRFVGCRGDRCHLGGAFL